jgi:hypothetical protein
MMKIETNKWKSYTGCDLQISTDRTLKHQEKEEYCSINFQKSEGGEKKQWWYNSTRETIEKI